MKNEKKSEILFRFLVREQMKGKMIFFFLFDCTEKVKLIHRSMNYLAIFN